MFHRFKQSFSKIMSLIFKRDRIIPNDVSIISSNCIGGLIYHNTNHRFLSPTINMYFTANDFLTFVENLEEFVSLKPVLSERDTVEVGFPVFLLSNKGKNVKLYFKHYNSAEEALSKWEERKQRINFNKVVIIMTDRDGFDLSCFNRFCNLKYKKVLYSSKNYHDKNVVFIKKFKKENQVGIMTDFADFFGKRYFEKYFDIYNFLNNI